MRLRAPITAILLATAACAPVTQAPEVDPKLKAAEAAVQRQLAVEQMIADTRRLHNLVHPMLVANADLCANKDKDLIAGKTGFLAMSKLSFEHDYRGAAERTLGTGKGARVIAVTPGSPAAKGGLRENDLIVAVGRVDVPDDENADEKFEKLLREHIRKGGSIALRVRRDGADRDVVIRPVMACDYGYRVVADEQINAFADGRRVVFFTGIMRMASNDDELAAVVGHELAHNLMGHGSVKQANQMLGAVADLLFAGFGLYTDSAFEKMGATAYSQEFETEADYVGLYLMARAGFDIRRTPMVWRRMALKNPGHIRGHHAASHPSTPYRYVTLEKTVAEIARKQAAGLPLMPELKKAD